MCSFAPPNQDIRAWGQVPRFKSLCVFASTRHGANKYAIVLFLGFFFSLTSYCVCSPQSKISQPSAQCCLRECGFCNSLLPCVPCCFSLAKWDITRDGLCFFSLILSPPSPWGLSTRQILNKYLFTQQIFLEHVSRTKHYASTGYNSEREKEERKKDKVSTFIV